MIGIIGIGIGAPEMRVPATAREAKIHAVITRADGTVVDLGCISYWHKNPLKRMIWRLSRWLRS